MGLDSIDLRQFANAAPTIRVLYSMNGVLESLSSSWMGGTEGDSMVEEGTARSLALAVHRREEGAFERLVQLHERGLLDYARRLLGHAEDAQEVVQDAFVRAYRALTRQYAEQRVDTLLLRPWLYRITRNLALNKRRGKRRQIEEGLAPLPDHEGLGPPIAGPTPVADLEKQQEIETLERALQTLPEASRELIVLRFIEEMPYAELAVTLGTSEAALRGKVFRALRLLRSALNPSAEPTGDVQ